MSKRKVKVPAQFAKLNPQVAAEVQSVLLDSADLSVVESPDDLEELFGEPDLTDPAVAKAHEIVEEFLRELRSSKL